MQSTNKSFAKQVSAPPTYEYRKTGEVFDKLILDLEHPKPVEMPTGITKLDGVIGGLHRGHLTVVAARPGGGKTALAVQIAWKLAKDGLKVFYFSLEMSKEEIITRVICNELEIEHDLIYKGKDIGNLMPKIKAAKELFNKTPFIVFDDIGYRFNDIDYVVKDFGKNKPDVVVIDHVQLVDKTGFNSPTDALEQYARKCKEYSRTTRTAWMMLSQINRDAEKRTGSPRLENLKGSGALEEMADAVVIGSWDGYDGDQYKLDVAKHRHGRRGIMIAKFEPKIFKFKNIDTPGYIAPHPQSNGHQARQVPMTVRNFGMVAEREEALDLI